MKELKPDKILKYRVSNPNYIGHSKCTGKFETEEEAVTTVKNWLVDVMMDDQDGWARKQFVDYKIKRKEKDNKIIFILTGKQRYNSGNIGPRESLVTRIIKPIEWELVYS